MTQGPSDHPTEGGGSFCWSVVPTALTAMVMQNHGPCRHHHTLYHDSGQQLGGSLL